MLYATGMEMLRVSFDFSFRVRYFHEKMSMRKKNGLLVQCTWCYLKPSLVLERDETLI